MTTPVKTFTCKIEDIEGGVYPQAFVAVRAFSKTSQDTGEASDQLDVYAIETQLEAITYKVNYWYDAQKKAAAKRSRPLITEVDGEFKDFLKVDLEHLEVVSILNSGLEPTDKVLRAIQSDLTRKFV